MSACVCVSQNKGREHTLVSVCFPCIPTLPCHPYLLLLLFVPPPFFNPIILLSFVFFHLPTNRFLVFPSLIYSSPLPPLLLNLLLLPLFPPPSLLHRPRSLASLRLSISYFPPLYKNVVASSHFYSSFLLVVPPLASFCPFLPLCLFNSSPFTP